MALDTRMPPVKLGKYKLVRRLAQGGMGEVWEGALEGSKGFARRVAIKRMTGLEDVPGWENMFLDEARIASALHHANIVPVLDYGVEDGKPFQVLELIDGIDSWKMAQLAAEKKVALPYEVALHLCTEVAHALHYAHNARGEDGRRLKIVHRDVTPDNVLVSWEGDVKLSDFGIAKARDKSHKTQVGVRVGKPSYMSPEQATGGDVDERTDVFMLGCVLQALLTGRSPLAGDNRMADLLTGTELPVDVRLPEDIKAIVARAVKRSKAERFQDAQELAICIRLVERTRLGGVRELLELTHGLDGQAGERGDIRWSRRTPELLLERSFRAADGGDLRARVPGQRIEPAKFVEHGAADAHVAIRARLRRRALVAEEGLDEREFSGAREVLARDMHGQTAVERAEHSVDDGECVSQRGGGGERRCESHGERGDPGRVYDERGW